MWFVQDVFLKWSIWWNVPEKKQKKTSPSSDVIANYKCVIKREAGHTLITIRQRQTTFHCHFHMLRIKLNVSFTAPSFLDLGQKYCAVAETNLCWSHAGKMCLFYQLKAGKQLLTVPLSQGGTTAGSSAWFARVHCHVSLMTQPR